MRPLLPSLEAIEPYLKNIDENRWYSNYGPLVISLEERFCEFFHVPPGSVVSLSSGTSGLVNALRAVNPPKDSFCLIPSWTFVATASAPLAANMQPYFIDVNEDSWAITPEIVKAEMDKVDGKIGAVIAVCPFGAPANTEEWDKFTEDTGIPVVIDAAASFDAISTLKQSAPGNTPIMVSLHATKLCGCGEGGIVVSKNSGFIRKIRDLSNFGFSGTREVKTPGTNGKMSEYNAAVAHAALDQWAQKRNSWVDLRHKYLEALNSLGDGIAKIWIDDDWASSTCNIRLNGNNADEIVEALNKAGVESKQWWMKGCHKQLAYASCPRADLPVTEALGESILGLPFSVDMEDEDIEAVVETLKNILNKQESRKAG